MTVPFGSRRMLASLPALRHGGIRLVWLGVPVLVSAYHRTMINISRFTVLRYLQASGFIVINKGGRRGEPASGTALRGPPERLRVAIHHGGHRECELLHRSENFI